MLKKIQNSNTLILAILLSMAFTLFYSCTKDEELTGETDEEEVITDDSDFEPIDWTRETHSNDVEPNFQEVFDNHTVKRIDIVITEQRWQTMLVNMTDLYGSFGTGGGPGGGFSDENPSFVPAEVFYNGIEWYRVGVRFKGNSSLRSTWKNGILKLSFKLDFDEFEDDYPQIDNQRFFGFKQLSLKNNFDDLSMLREKVAGEIFMNSGLVAPYTAFYTVYVDHGEGPIYFGLYTMVEEVDDTVIDTQFSDNDGNLYKPDGEAATFAAGSYDEDEYEKKTNENGADFSDVQKLLSILHDDSRTTNPESWRAGLDSIFDTDLFLKYLAVNTVIQNWDTYGKMTHNYFLYNNPETNKLTWIPWDNNEALQEGKMGGAVALDFSDVSATRWPLIGYLYQDEVYRSKYDDFVDEVIKNAFEVGTIQALYSDYSSLIEPYATAEISGYTFLNSSSDFNNAVSALKTHVTSRANAVENYLN